nr:hypothetical protein Iba_chr15bCG6790 [Ipomoea batatas]
MGLTHQGSIYQSYDLLSPVPYQAPTYGLLSYIFDPLFKRVREISAFGTTETVERPRFLGDIITLSSGRWPSARREMFATKGENWIYPIFVLTLSVSERDMLTGCLHVYYPASMALDSSITLY